MKADEQKYPVNPDRNVPWNNLPDLPIASSLYRDLDIYEQLGNAKEALALAKLKGGIIM